MLDAPDFNFIKALDLRAGLASDYQELRSCLAAKAWKAAHVLSGSIVETVLVDHLLTIKYKDHDPLKMTLDDLISACTETGVLSKKTADLSTVIRTYRNLIHPGRVKRLGETVDEEGALIANSLVTIIVREVADKQERDYGLTAEQLLTKFQNDSSAFSISKHLLGDMPSDQVERLLLESLPAKYFQVMANENPFMPGSASDKLLTLERLYRLAFDQASDELKKKATKRFVSVVREESGERVQIFEERFFRGSDLAYLSPTDRNLIKDHVLSGLGEGYPELKMIECLEGISFYLDDRQLDLFFMNLIRTLAYANDDEVRDAASERLRHEQTIVLPESRRGRLPERLDAWIDFLNARERPDAATRVSTLKTELAGDDDIPF